MHWTYLATQQQKSVISLTVKQSKGRFYYSQYITLDKDVSLQNFAVGIIHKIKAYLSYLIQQWKIFV